ncbi:MAG: pyridoxamine 5'-phosphate oxidase family protein [Roseovarius sp.]|nr:pyridoxamine 5'-phosphate oxidase family protein [Roseovarius sp.]
MPLNDTAEALIVRFPLGCVATVTPEGWPAVSPKGIRVRGTTRVVAPGAEFDALIGQWRAAWGDLAGRINALVLIGAEHVKPMTPPPYDDGVSEADMVALYKQKFSEIYP